MGFAERMRAELERAELPGRVGFAAWDLAEREPVLLDAERVVHSASTIKVLIMITALRAVQAGRLGLDDPRDLPAERVGGAGVLRLLSSVDRMSLRDLIVLMIVISDNEATNAVIDAVGFDAIRDCAADLGCTATRVERHLMRHHEPGRNETTALDQARVLDRLASGEALPPELTEHALGVLAEQQVRDRLPALLPAGVSCWNKTGELLGLRHDVGLIGTGRPQLVIAVLVDELTDDRSLNDYRGGPACDAIAALGRSAYDALL
ncbi:class A beta-lactamase-related serine hydrolase [Saccharopolyspora sp. WRP15-2]|uniref:Class A beta-lactamase-related serine hydrolase n=1 Tax=Saccharopolyspora oryzae TaxID=2997343 RepID=A0ABT4V118_9PSEU|nr:serine hydrolase [Saccharopolyspora oryzae]MDA3627017.1 class A beta-lactamase-related serine hydrolase [Saccharopolyspora oryzae]